MTRIGIIGGGVIGAAIAYELSAVSGITVALFEAQEPGEGATGAAFGVLMGVISQKTGGRGWRLRQVSGERYRTLIPELETLTGQTIPVNRQGLLKLLATQDERWAMLQKKRAAQGYPLEIWDRDRVINALPWLKPTPLVGAIYSPWDWQIFPKPLTQALIHGAQQRGVTVHRSTPVHSLDHTSQEPVLHTHQGSYTVDGVIVTAGLGSGLLTAGDVTVEPVIGQALQITFPDSVQPYASPWTPVLTAEDIHFVPLDAHTGWIGATVEFPKNGPQGLPYPPALEELWQRAIAWYPILKQGKRGFQWQGKRPRPVGESAPVIRPLTGSDTVLIATGHYRNGVLLAPATAQEVREWVRSRFGD